MKTGLTLICALLFASALHAAEPKANPKKTGKPASAKKAEKAPAAPAAKAAPVVAAPAAPAPAPAAPAPKKPGRLDPHGTPDLDLKSANIDQLGECKVCHVLKGTKVETKPEPENLCAGCHGRLPHSGAVEHVGEEPGGGAGLNCLSCHRPHRANPDGVEPAPKGSGFFKLKRNNPNLPQNLIDRPRRGDGMIGHPCSECHDFS